MVEFHSFFAHAGFNGIHLNTGIFYRSFSCFQGFQAVQPCSLLGASGTASSCSPFQFHTENAAAFPVTGKLHLFSLSLQFQKLGIIASIGIQFAMADFQDTVGYAVQEITVMRYHDHSSPKSPEKILQPRYHLSVQVVGRLVQNQDICRVEKHSCQSHSFFLAAGKIIHIDILVCDPQSIQHTACLALCTPVFLPFSLCHIIQNGHMLRKFRCLGKPADTDPVLGDHLSLIWFFFSCDHAEQSGLSCPVHADDPDLLALVNTAGNIIKDHFVTKNLMNVFYVQNIHALSSPFMKKSFP